MRTITRAGIVVALAASLAACNVTSGTQAAIKQILANPAALSPAQFAAALSAIDPSLAAKIESAGKDAVAIATATCGIVPLASSLAAVAAAAYGAEGVVLPATQIAAAFCKPFQVSATPSTTVKVTRVAPHVVGTTITRTVRIGDIDVPVTGTIVAPALVH